MAETFQCTAIIKIQLNSIAELIEKRNKLILVCIITVLRGSKSSISTDFTEQQRAFKANGLDYF